MTFNKLKLGMEKTEFLIGSEHNLRSYPNLTLNIDTTEIKPVSSVRNLGVFMDSEGLMTSQVGDYVALSISNLEILLASGSIWIRTLATILSGHLS